MLKSFKNYLLYIFNNFKLKLTSVFDPSICLKNVIKTSIFDSHFIEISNYTYDNLLIENFINTKILQNILNNYRKENLRFFKCVVVFKTTEFNLIRIPLENVYSIDSNQIYEDLKKKVVISLDNYEDDNNLVIEQICVKILFIDPNFIIERKKIL
jgi:hypothetical protein